MISCRRNCGTGQTRSGKGGRVFLPAHESAAALRPRSILLKTKRTTHEHQSASAAVRSNFPESGAPAGAIGRSPGQGTRNAQRRPGFAFPLFKSRRAVRNRDERKAICLCRALGKRRANNVVHDAKMVDFAQEALMTRDKLPPVHPGEILLEEYLNPMGISQYRLAKELSVPPRRINEIVHGTRGITADTALRFARFFGTSEMFWINLQTRYDIKTEKDKLAGRLEKEVSVYSP